MFPGNETTHHILSERQMAIKILLMIERLTLTPWFRVELNNRDLKQVKQRAIIDILLLLTCTDVWILLTPCKSVQFLN